MSTPKLFVSYSWTSPEHEQWVLDLATELAGNGVEVLLDKWDLREGQDSIAFMERMVNDPEVHKVILVCDRGYASKTNERQGGVGTEAQIISPEIYAKQDQRKFVAVIAEVDEDGKPYLPTYYKSRIYVDLSQADRFSEGFEQLLRWVFDRPLYVKPEIGKPPSYITEPVGVVRTTAAAARRAIEALKANRSSAGGAVEEYLARFAEDLEKYRIEKWTGERDEQVAKSIEEFLPGRHEYLAVLLVMLQYAGADAATKSLHRFLESLLPLMKRPSNVHRWDERDYDNFKFIVHELFLLTIAALLRAEQFSAARNLLVTPYVERRPDGVSTTSYGAFRQPLRSFEARNQRLGRISARADLLKQRSDGALPFHYLMQADFVCWLRAAIHGEKWWPETLIYAEYELRHGPFEIFARAVSREYSDKVFKLLDIAGGNQVRDYLQAAAQNNGRGIPQWEGALDVEQLCGLDGMGTRP